MASEEARHNHASTIGWILSCTLHGTVVIGSLLFVQRIQLAPQLEPFKWNVVMVSSEKIAPAASQPTPQPQEQARFVETAPVRRPAPPKPAQPFEPPPVMPTVAPPSPPPPPSTPTQTIEPLQPATASSSPAPIPLIKTSESPASTPKPLESVRTTEINPTPSPRPTIHEQQAEPPPPEPVRSTTPGRAQLPPSSAEMVKTELPQPVESPLPAVETPEPQPPSRSRVVESALPNIAPAQEMAATLGRPPQVVSLPSKSPPSTAKPDYGWLSDTIVRRVEELKRYPAEARLEQAQGKVVVKVVIQEDGSVIDVEIVKSSGFQILDHAALDLMHQAGPFHLTRPLGKPTLVIRVPISYAIDRP